MFKSQEPKTFRFENELYGDSEAKESSIHDYVKFVPSVVIVRKGEVVDEDMVAQKKARVKRDFLIKDVVLP